MPRGPQGEKRPADVNARAVMIAKIAIGEIEETPRPSKKGQVWHELTAALKDRGPA